MLIGERFSDFLFSIHYFFLRQEREIHGPRMSGRYKVKQPIASKTLNRRFAFYLKIHVNIASYSRSTCKNSMAMFYIVQEANTTSKKICPICAVLYQRPSTPYHVPRAGQTQLEKHG